MKYKELDEIFTAKPIKEKRLEILKIDLENIDILCYPPVMATDAVRVQTSKKKDPIIDIVEQREKYAKNIEKEIAEINAFLAKYDIMISVLNDKEKEIIDIMYDPTLTKADIKDKIESKGCSIRNAYHIRNKAFEKISRG